MVRDFFIQVHWLKVKRIDVVVETVSLLVRRCSWNHVVSRDGLCSGKPWVLLRLPFRDF